MQPKQTICAPNRTIPDATHGIVSGSVLRERQDTIIYSPIPNGHYVGDAVFAGYPGTPS